MISRLSGDVLQALLRLPLLWNLKQVCGGFPREGVRVAAAVRGVPHGVHDALLCVQHNCQQRHAGEQTLSCTSTSCWMRSKAAVSNQQDPNPLIVPLCTFAAV